mgnify:CR=1 FL=1
MITKILFVILTLGIPVLASSQAQSAEYVKVYGKVLSKKDSSVVAATLSYEKLPYYDDMGLSKTNLEGYYEFYLISGVTYIFTIKGTGYQTKTLEIKVTDQDEDQEMLVNHYLETDGEVQLITLENLIFSRASDQISSSSYQELDQLVEWLDERPRVIIQLEGHTDFDGNADANMRLSQARVESVKDYLKSKGINKKRVLTKAFGGTQPLSTERTDDAKARNRRVEVRVIRK